LLLYDDGDIIVYFIKSKQRTTTDFIDIWDWEQTEANQGKVCCRTCIQFAIQHLYANANCKLHTSCMEIDIRSVPRKLI